jgi:magnesium chelatase family protein
VKGQETAKRALEIAAAGNHNLLMIGPPGSGKSMLAQRMPGLLPPLVPAEALEVSMIHSVAGAAQGRPASPGGGRSAIRIIPPRCPRWSAAAGATRPGEISLAHRGVLFLDELPEFPRPALEALRQPMETGRATVSPRPTPTSPIPPASSCIAAMNPCRCGYLGDPGPGVRPRPALRRRLPIALSGPLLDRMDLTIEVMPIPPAELTRAPAGETSAAVAARIHAARHAQRARFGEDGPRSNAEAAIEHLMPLLEPEAGTLLETAATRLRLSSRAHVRTLRVALSIADLAGSTTIRRAHVAEALAFRHRMPGRAAA